MSSGRRFATIGAVGLVAWYLATLLFWAIQPLHDSVPVGLDTTLKPPAPLSINVTCNSLFAGSARDNRPLPALNEQPKDQKPLKYPRQPCELPHSEARGVFLFDTVVFLGVAGAGLWLVRRQRRVAEPEPALSAA